MATATVFVTDLVFLILLEKNEMNTNPFKLVQVMKYFFTDKEPYFERNRMLFAFNYKPSKATTIQVGYLHQFDYKINDETGRDFFQIGFFCRIVPKDITKHNY